ncbi:hypothetical protein BBJ28_00021720, partial [Nothophytophthora sp. Chile5]
MTPTLEEDVGPATLAQGVAAPTTPVVSYASGKEMMAQGPMVLHQDIAGKVESALGRPLTHMELRFKHVSLAADLLTVPTNDQQTKDSRDELPTLSNQVMKAFASLSAKKNSVRKHILQDVTGSFRPGTTTLVLGQSGSGKSALMKLLSGRFPMDKEITMEGEMLYNGVSREKLLKRLPQLVNYVTQTDTHLPTLTVRETLEFANECCGPTMSKRTLQLFNRASPEENAKAVEAARNVFRFYPDIVLHTLGLETCQHTIVGSAMYRGISGGEKKRVTTGEMEFGLRRVTLMDEISTGLDSAAAFDIIAAERSLAQKLHKAVVISLLQPSPEIFALFDDVLLMNEGRVLYHGPALSVQSYFESLGFICPPERDLADFLCDLATPQQIQYQKGRPPLGFAMHPAIARDFAELWVISPLYQQLETEAEAREAHKRADTQEESMSHVREFHQSFWASTWTLSKRQILLTRRNTAFLRSRAILVVVMGLLFASLYYKMNLADTQLVMGVVFASVLILGLGQQAMLVTFFDARAVFYKQRAANFYRTSSYVLAASVSQIPLALMESLVFGSLVYWLCGFVSEAAAFVLFELFLTLGVMIFGALVFFLAAVSPNLNVAKPLSMVSLLVFILFAGFIVSKNGIPDWLIWLYWLDPVAWAVRSIAVSQYRTSELDRCVYKSVDYCATYNQTMGEYSLGLFDVPADKSWVGYGVIFMAGAYVVLMLMSCFILEYRRYERPEQIALSNDQEEDRLSIPELGGLSPANGSTYSLIKSPFASGMIDPARQQASSEVTLRVPNNSHKPSIPPVSVAFKDLWYT